MLEKLRKRIQNCCATLRRSRNNRNVGRCWFKSLTGFKLCTRATTCNKVDKRTQLVSSNNVGSCWPGKLCPFARGLTWQKRRKIRVTGLNRLPRDFQPIVCNALGCKEDASIARRQKTKKTSENITFYKITKIVRAL